MSTINGRACVANGKPVDKVFSNGQQVYGRNLLTNTGYFNVGWVTNGNTISTTIEYNGHFSMVISNKGMQQLAAQNMTLGSLKNSTQYTASFWAKADNVGDKAHTELWGSKGAANIALTTNWVRYTAVVTSYYDAGTNGAHSALYFWGPNDNKGNIYIAELKLELGTTATPWTPAPEDVGATV